MREQDKFGIDRFRSSYPERVSPAGGLERDTGDQTPQARRTPPVLNFGRLKRLAARIAICSAGSLLLAFLVVAAPAPSSAQVSVGISVTIAPPALPIYVQPVCPAPGYIWTPGYWAWDPDFGYYWVPGTWVLAPYPGWFWTPGYWGWYGGAYVWYVGYWGPVIGFYGGINYGFGYNGYGYYGGYWDRGTFYYNRTVNNISTTNITNYYSKPVPRSATTARVSYNGGRGGAPLRPTAAQLDARKKGSAPIAAQKEQEQAARRDPGLRASVNRGRPAIAATPKPGAFRDPGVVRASRAGAPYKAPPGTSEKPTKPAGAERPIKPAGAERPTKPAGAERPTKPAGAERPTKPAGAERPTKPADIEKRQPGTAPRREAPAEPKTHPAAPRSEPARPATKPIERPSEPRREQPRPDVERPQTAPRRAPETPQIAPQPRAPRAAPERKETPRPTPRGGKEREEGKPHPQ